MSETASRGRNSIHVHWFKYPNLPHWLLIFIKTALLLVVERVIVVFIEKSPQNGADSLTPPRYIPHHRVILIEWFQLLWDNKGSEMMNRLNSLLFTRIYKLFLFVLVFRGVCERMRYENIIWTRQKCFEHVLIDKVSLLVWIFAVKSA